MEGNRIPKTVLLMNLESTRPRNRWKDEVGEDGRTVEEWKENVYNREWQGITTFCTCQWNE
jgi:hypothetical protein